MRDHIWGTHLEGPPLWDPNCGTPRGGPTRRIPLGDHHPGSPREKPLNGQHSPESPHVPPSGELPSGPFCAYPLAGNPRQTLLGDTLAPSWADPHRQAPLGPPRRTKLGGPPSVEPSPLASVRPSSRDPLKEPLGESPMEPRTAVPALRTPLCGPPSCDEPMQSLQKTALLDTTSASPQR